MNITFLEEASREFLDASAYYEDQQTGLGQRFEEEIDRVIRWLVENPESLPLRRGVYRRLNLHIFPYDIPYVVRGSTLWAWRLHTRTDNRSIGSKDLGRLKSQDDDQNPFAK